MPQIITCAVIKGGTGKTTTAAAIAQAAVKDGRRVLCVDMDAQANLTFITGADKDAPGSYELLKGAAIADTIQRTAQGLDVIAGAPMLANEKTTSGSINRLKDALEGIKRKYDLIVIDTPPALSELTYNALMASNGALIPLETDAQAIQGLFMIHEVIRKIQTKNKPLKLSGCIVTKYDKRPQINRYYLDGIKQSAEAEKIPYLMEIRQGIAIREAQTMRQSIFDYAPKSKPAEDYQTLYNKIIYGG